MSAVACVHAAELHGIDILLLFLPTLHCLLFSLFPLALAFPSSTLLPNEEGRLKK